MSDYRRWISYIYAYENGVKKRNAGYAKLELKDGSLTMSLHVTPEGRNGKYRVCLYKNQPGRREGVLLGELDKGSGSDCARFTENASDLGGSGLLFQEMNGLLLYDENGRCLISSWEDTPVEMPAVQEVIALLEQRKRAEENSSAAGAAVSAGRMEETENAAEVFAEEAGNSPGVFAEETGNSPEVFAEETGNTAEVFTEKAGNSAGVFAEKAENAREAPSQAPADAIAVLTEASAGTEEAAFSAVGETADAEQRAERRIEPQMQQKEKISAAGTQDTARRAPTDCRTEKERAGSWQRAEQPERERAGNWQRAEQPERENAVNQPGRESAVPRPGRLESRIFNCLSPMYPFEHQEFERSVRMEPQDIGLLPREMWKYAGNSFLLHSYYAYHHILFVRRVRREQRNCYLMLPGVYEPKEQHMAQLFGFTRFCPVRKKALQQGDFGYWYMEVGFSGDVPEGSAEGGAPSGTTAPGEGAENSCPPSGYEASGNMSPESRE